MLSSFARVFNCKVLLNPKIQWLRGQHTSEFIIKSSCSVQILRQEDQHRSFTNGDFMRLTNEGIPICDSQTPIQ